MQIKLETSLFYMDLKVKQKINLSFVEDFELKLDHLQTKVYFFIVVLDHFNARSRGWYKNDIKIFKGSKIDMVASFLS